MNRTQRTALEQLAGALEAVERLGICGCDVDATSPEEHEAIRGVVVVLQQHAQGYPDDETTPRLTHELRRILAQPAPDHTALIGKWRSQAVESDGVRVEAETKEMWVTASSEQAHAMTLRACANQLEAALRGEAQP